MTLNEKERELYKVPSFILADLEDDDVNDEYKDNYLVETENGKACGFLNVSVPEVARYRILGFHNVIGDNTVQLAYEIARRANYGVKDKAGNEPYFNHPKRVYRTALTFGDEKGLGEAALLHDVVEDTPYTLESLHDEFAKIGKGTYFDLYIRDFLDAVTHRKNAFYKEPYDEYMKRVYADEKASKVKMADLLDNTRFCRLSSFDSEDEKRSIMYVHYIKELETRCHLLGKAEEIRKSA